MTLKQQLKQLFYRLPYVRTLYKEVAAYKKNAFFPAGHYYSAIADVDDIVSREKEIWKHITDKELAGIDLNPTRQLQLCTSWESLVAAWPYQRNATRQLRFNPDNTFFGHSDAFALYALITQYQPKHIIEVGSGHSTALMLDCNEYIASNTMHIHCIEPDPARLFSLIREADKNNLHIEQKRLQEIPVSYFTQLQKNDILFIDSTHVCKTGSDVNYLLFDILPALNDGVLIHFHDVFYPFEYPLEWVQMGRNWNEIYLLRAFLTAQTQYRILHFLHYLQVHHGSALQSLPTLQRDRGQSLWLVKESATTPTG